MKNKINANNTLEKKIYENILNSKCIQNNDKIVVGVSGGSDSMALIDFLYKYKDKFKEENINYEICVAHVNHMIREESAKEKEYVESYCAKRKIPFFYLKCNVEKLSKDNKMGTEEYARKVRYEFFNKVLNENRLNKIAVAHNSNDNVETILLNIIRGTGIKGLCGMDYVNGNLIRPFIDITKEETVKYCNENNVKYYIDRTNLEDKYTRNKVRLNLIPILETEYNSNVINNILRLKNLAKLDEEFLNSYTKSIVDSMIVKQEEGYIIFNYKELLNISDSIKQRSIREIIFRLVGNTEGIQTIHVVDILKLLKNNLPKKKYIIGNKFNLEITKKYIAIIYRKEWGNE